MIRLIDDEVANDASPPIPCCVLVKQDRSKLQNGTRQSTQLKLQYPIRNCSVNEMGEKIVS